MNDIAGLKQQLRQLTDRLDIADLFNAGPSGQPAVIASNCEAVPASTSTMVNCF
jgi:hypothetical protein